MKRSVLFFILLLALSQTGWTADRTVFRVTVENVATDLLFPASGTFSTAAVSAGPITPGQAFEFTITAQPGDHLSFATMFAQSNDLFYAPADSGIALYDGNGSPVTGDVTSQVYLWDAGTELNQEPGVGTDQAPRQAAANTGAADTLAMVRIVNDGFTYPAVDSVIKVTLSNTGSQFTVRIQNVSSSTTLHPSDNSTQLIPLSPLAWVVHTSPSLLFTTGQADAGNGLESLAEDGNPTSLAASLPGKTGVQSSGSVNTAAPPAGPLTPGYAFEFSFAAPAGSHLSFSTMFGSSNDLFYAPADSGIALWNSDNTPVSGDVTSQVYLWDAGTEANQEPGVGSDQAPWQSAANTGAADPDNTVRKVNDGFTYPAVSDVMKVTITPSGTNDFTVRIENVSTSTTLQPSDNSMQSVPLSPGVYVVHTAAGALFTEGQANAGNGLEAQAEDGNPATLYTWLSDHTGIATPLSPGAWAVHSTAGPFFTSSQADRGMGLEAQAEDGDPSSLAASVVGQSGVSAGGAFAIPEGGTAASPALPGDSFSFMLSGVPGDRVSFASMYGQSNDLFYGPDANGIALFDASGNPVTGDVTDQISLWDAGTEANQPPGIGSDQAPRQSAPNTGAADPDATVRLVSDGYYYAPVNKHIRVTLTPMTTTAFQVRIRNVSMEGTLMPSDNSQQAVPLAPGAWAVHMTPGALFTDGTQDAGLGLEALAEDGDPSMLAGQLPFQSGVIASGAFNTPIGATAPGPLVPGNDYGFTAYAVPGARLSFATMFVPSNDLFYAPSDTGLALWDANSMPVNGDVTMYIHLWDAGTEANEEPGTGPNQAQRQSGPNTGPADQNTNVRLVSDSFTYPAVTAVLKVTITPAGTAQEVTAAEDTTSEAALLFNTGADTLAAANFTAGNYWYGFSVMATETSQDMNGATLLLQPEGKTLSTDVLQRTQARMGLVGPGGTKALPASAVANYFEVQTSLDEGNLLRVAGTIQYDPADLTFPEQDLIAARLDENIGRWVRVATTVDTVNNTVSFLTNRFSLWVLGNTNDPTLAEAPVLPLPVELAALTAGVTAGDQVTLQWSTESESNNFGFYVERSSDEGVTWTEIGFIEGSGTSDQHRNYQWSDAAVESGTSYRYRLRQVDFDGAVEYSESVAVTTGLPDRYSLAQNFPNPFNPSTNISFELKEAGTVRLAVYNVLGRKVMTLIDGDNLAAGRHVQAFNFSQLSSGTYFYRIEVNGYSQVRRMLLLK